MLDSQVPAYLEAVDQFVADRAEAFDVQLQSPWSTMLSASDHPRALADDLIVASVAAHAAAKLQRGTADCFDDVVDNAFAEVRPKTHRFLDRDRVIRRVRALLLRAQLKAASMPSTVPQELAATIHALQARWEAVSAVLEAFARGLEAVTSEHGHGLALSACDARRRQAEIDSSAYSELRQRFIEHYSSGAALLQIDDTSIRNLVLDSDDSAAGLFSPIRAFTLLHNQFATHAPDMVRRQAADAFVDAFWLRADTAPRTVRGKVVIELRVWIDALDKAHGGKVRYSYDSKTRIEKALHALANLWLHLRGTGDERRMQEELAQCLRAFSEADWEPRPGLKPALLGVEMRCFQGRIDCFLPEAFAADINAFVTMHSVKLRER